MIQWGDGKTVEDPGRVGSGAWRQTDFLVKKIGLTLRRGLATRD